VTQEAAALVRVERLPQARRRRAQSVDDGTPLGTGFLRGFAQAAQPVSDFGARCQAREQRVGALKRCEHAGCMQARQTAVARDRGELRVRPALRGSEQRVDRAERGADDEHVFGRLRRREIVPGVDRVGAARERGRRHAGQRARGQGADREHDVVGDERGRRRA
jgi:hypothetical protein